MMRSKIKFFTIVFIAACAGSAGAAGLESLENFIKTVKTGRTDFTQVVTVPVKQGQVARVKTSSGTFAFARPGRFQFVYQKPFAQTIVADGQTLWLYDEDLNQVTGRKQAQALGASPAALIASAADLHALQADFYLASDGQVNGVEWVLATPKTQDSALQSVRVGFRAGVLAQLDIVDSFGQQSSLRFQAFQANVVLAPSSFQFKPPTGADVIRP